LNDTGASGRTSEADTPDREGSELAALRLKESTGGDHVVRNTKVWRSQADFPVLIVRFRIGDSHGEALAIRSGAFKDDFLLDVQRVPWRLASVTHPGHPADRKAGRASNSRPHIFCWWRPGELRHCGICLRRNSRC
jgi:hypothetical protein